MEEHFRKSLGEDYSKVFKESEKKKVQQVEEENSPSEEMEVDPVKAFKEDLDMSGYTGIANIWAEEGKIIIFDIF